MDVTACQDWCLASQPDCVGFTVYHTDNQCYLKTKLAEQNCNAASGFTTGELVHYDCGDNHNCGGSFVRFQDKNIGQVYQQKKTYCGKENPVEFYSSNKEAIVKIQLDSTLKSGNNLPEFKNIFHL